MKKTLIVANWKMNPESLAEAKELFGLIKTGIKNVKKSETVICPPFPYLSAINSFRQKSIKIGAQDCFWENKGAFTGEVSPAMLKDMGVEYVIIGHSERRKHFRESWKTINKKIKAVLSSGLKPILCISNLSQFNKSSKEAKNLLIAYEPVFAIGTGKACDTEKAGSVRRKINNDKVLYGGSVNSENAVGYLKKAFFQGLLIGGASLDSKEFLKIIKNIDLS